MFKAVRLFWGSDYSRLFAEMLKDSLEKQRTLSTYLKRREYSVYGLVDYNTLSPMAYVVVSTYDGDESLTCHHMQEIVKGGISYMSIMTLLDHTGSTDLMLLAATPEQERYLSSMGFILVENNWLGKTALYRDVQLDKRIMDISGMESPWLTESRIERLGDIAGQSIYVEGESDPLKRSIFKMVSPTDVIARAGTAPYRTVIWFDGVIKGMAQSQYVGGNVFLSGLGVLPEFQKERIGRNLVAALLKEASNSCEDMMASTFSLNQPCEHLLGSVLRWQRLPPSYGLAHNPDTVSWKKPKRHGIKKGEQDNPTFTETAKTA